MRFMDENCKEFIRILTFRMQKILKNSQTTEKRKLKIKKNNDAHNYCIDVFSKNGNLISTLAQVDYVIIFLKRFPNRKFYEEQGIYRSDYLQYHLEMYYLKVSSLLDLILLLTNELFRLGIQERKCSFEIITTNKLIKSEKIIDVIKKVDKAFRDIKYIRNLAVHRGEYNQGEFEMLSFFELVDRFPDIAELPFDPKYHLKSGYRNAIQKKCEQLEELNNCVAWIISLFYKEAIIIFNKKLAELESKQ